YKVLELFFCDKKCFHVVISFVPLFLSIDRSAPADSYREIAVRSAIPPPIRIETKHERVFVFLSDGFDSSIIGLDFIPDF
ncbi:MAG: hypothetical protein VZQ95_09965, partial [Erysipelotrichaceae bacterium]|nr:hypothetical protein [Erysipelotrichaceae bacterium]